jgi:preprotein translocase subunit SecF
VGPTWGGEITRQALIALGVYLTALVIFLSIYFQWKMAAAAMVALFHDILITAGIYALVGFEVTPATVIGLLTILGYSLYDTVVVFDKVKENTQGITGQSRYTFSELANLALNQTLVRSINTSIVALLPIAAILFVGAGLLGAGTLKDLALVLFIGMAVGTYSSLFVATPVLCAMKEREPAMKALRQRVLKRRAARGETPKGRDTSAGKASGEVVTATGGLAPAVDRPHRQNKDTASRAQPKRQTRSQRRH